MTEPKLPGLMVVGVVRFNPGVKLSTAQGAIDRLYNAYQRADAALLLIEPYKHRLPSEVRAALAAALTLTSKEPQS